MGHGITFLSFLLPSLGTVTKSDEKYCNRAMPCVPLGVLDHSNCNGVLGLPPDAMVQEIDCIKMGCGIKFLFLS